LARTLGRFGALSLFGFLVAFECERFYHV
jgi:hypothetical protein